MDAPIKVFVLGSCVSRDPFEVADKRDFKLVSYYARSSFAALGSKPYIDEKILCGINSNFQRRVVRADMEKTVLTALEKTEFDVLLIDLIDERFGLAALNDSIHTVSSEYKKALYKPNPYRNIKAWSKEKSDLWEKGFLLFADFLQKNGLDNKVVVNCVYWSLNCESSSKILEIYSKEAIDIANENLEWMYGRIKDALPDARFINYNDDELVPDENHKWGVSPFHYSRGVWKKQINQLYEIYLDE